MAGARFSRVQALLVRAAELYDVTAEDILGRSKDHTPTQARQFAMWAVRELCGLSFPEIGRVFGRSHATVLVNVRRTRRRAETSQELRQKLKLLSALPGHIHHCSAGPQNSGSPGDASCW